MDFKPDRVVGCLNGDRNYTISFFFLVKIIDRQPLLFILRSVDKRDLLFRMTLTII